jgi:hypothetical protein
MGEFDSERKAKEYLIGKIVAEAERAGKPLTEIELKMLYFSETDWTLPDISDVNAEFERNYDEGEYQRKIARLARTIEAHLEGADEQESDTWYAAIEKLSDGDHYLLVLLNPALVQPEKPARPHRDLLKLWLTGIVIAFGLVALFALYERFFGPH